MAVNLWEDKHREEMLNIYALAYQSCFMDQCADPAVFQTATGAVQTVQTACAEEVPPRWANPNNCSFPNLAHCTLCGAELRVGRRPLD